MVRIIQSILKAGRRRAGSSKEISSDHWTVSQGLPESVPLSPWKTLAALRNCARPCSITRFRTNQSAVGSLAHGNNLAPTAMVVAINSGDDIGSLVRRTPRILLTFLL